MSVELTPEVLDGIEARAKEAQGERQPLAAHPDTVRALVAAARERDEYRRLFADLGFGDNQSSPRATPTELAEYVDRAFSAERDHMECPVVCELCGETLADTDCPECQGSGCKPNAELAYSECGRCAGVGKIHEGCVESSYADLARERDELGERLARTGEEVAVWMDSSQRVGEVLARVEAIHRDGGESQGYLPDGNYGCMAHACTVCGEIGEYGEPWPCPTIKVIRGESE